MNRKAEILAPAGDYESIAAAVLNGANAVYLGLLDFSARQNAKNFDKADLGRAVSYCHGRGVFVYVAINTLVSDSQLEKAAECIKLAAEAGVDALIVQDFAVAKMAKAICPTMPLHASTQMAVHTVEGARLLIEQGFSRVVLARELTLAEIVQISKLPIETEVFVHGALCMSVSGQCYMSSMIGGRSGNRGSCAGTCRLPFTIGSDKSAYDLSLKDNCLASHVAQLVNAGVTSLKIEGRMKRPEYVAAASRVYANARDGADYDLDTLRAVFSRSGFTDGYLADNINGDMFGFRAKEDVVSATPKLLKSLENTYKKEQPLVEVSIIAVVSQSEPVTLTMSDGVNAVTVAGGVPEAAKTMPTTAELLQKQLSKLGGTPFFLGEFKAEVGEGLSVSAAELNSLRRQACEQLLAKRSVASPHNTVDFSYISKGSHSPSPLKLRAHFQSLEQLPLDKIDTMEYIILPSAEVEKHQAELIKYADRIIVEPQRLMFKNEKAEIERLSTLYSAGFKHLQAENLAHIKIGSDIGFTLHGGAYLNCYNSLSLAEFEQMKLSDITISFELSLERVRRLSGDLPRGILAYGFLPLMIMKSCPVKARRDCKQCRQSATLTDRIGKRFRVLCHNKGYVEALNCEPLYMADRLKECTSLDFAALYFTVESKAEAADIIARYSGMESASVKLPDGTSYTRGLYYRET